MIYVIESTHTRREFTRVYRLYGPMPLVDKITPIACDNTAVYDKGLECMKNSLVIYMFGSGIHKY